jgi:hypothetical protein
LHSCFFLWRISPLLLKEIALLSPSPSEERLHKVWACRWLFGYEKAVQIRVARGPTQSQSNKKEYVSLCEEVCRSGFTELWSMHWSYCYSCLPLALACLCVASGSNKGWGGRGVGLMHHNIAWHICCLSWQLARIFFGALQLCRVASRRIFLALRQFYSNHSLLDQALGLRMRE